MKKLTAIAAIIISALIASASMVQPGLLDSQAAGTPDTFVISVTSEDLKPVEIDRTEQTAGRLTEYASKFLGRKYVWGATGPKNFDCSGFTSHVFRKEGINLPRTSRMQWHEGDKVEKDRLRPGDLMFFSSPRSGKGKVGHVGIVVSVDPDTKNVTFIHASSSKGITYQKFPDGGYYSRNYIGAKRVIGDKPAA